MKRRGVPRSEVELSWWRLLISGLAWVAILLFNVFAGTVHAQPMRAAIDSNFVFPPVAALAERVWIISKAPLKDGTVVWVGGHPARLTRTDPPGWYAFEVPKGVPGGSQSVSLVGPASPGTLRLTIAPDDALGDELAVYLRADLGADFQQRYRERLLAFAAACARLCPAELTDTIKQLSDTKIEGLEPLGGVGQRPGTDLPLARQPLSRPLPSVTPINPQVLNATRLNSLLRVPVVNGSLLTSAQGAGLCSQLSGRLLVGGLPVGRSIGLLNLLFWGEMGVDPIAGGHPAQALGPVPYKGKPPADILKDTLGITSGDGKGVIIHVLDTADGSADSFAMDKDVNYYNEVYPARPGHGSIVGAIAQAVAPNAKVVYQGVCQGDTCKTVTVVRALCAVAREARQGGKHVVNLSIGGSYPSLGLLLALNELATLGVPTAASFGNRDDCFGMALGDLCSHYPADWTKNFAVGTAAGAPTMLVSVAGWDVANKEYATYNRTAVVPWALNALPSVQAPGEFWFEAPTPTGPAPTPYFGTSFAAPVVSGLLANWMSCKPGLPFLGLITTPGQNPVPAAVLNACP